MAYLPHQKRNIANGKCALCGGEILNKVRKTCEQCRDTIGKRHKERTRRLRAKIFEHYGHSCECCGEDREPFLAIDHKEGTSRDGDQRNLTEWVVRNKLPSGFRILCHNCNIATRWGRACPHKNRAPGEK